MRKKLALFVGGIMLMSGLSGCGGTGDAVIDQTAPGAADTQVQESQEPVTDEAGGELVIWDMSTNGEEFAKKFEAANEGVKATVQTYSGTEYWQKLNAALKSGSGPDVFALDPNTIKGYVNTDLLMDLNDVKSTAEAECYPYVVDLATDADGNLKALSYQAAPGAYYYRSDLAEKYLGITSPEEMQSTYMKDLDSFRLLGDKLKEQSDKTLLVADINDLCYAMLGDRTEGWVNADNVLTYDENVTKLFDYGRQLYEAGELGQLVAWQADWFAAMNDDVEGVEVFGYFKPSWGLNYTLKPNAADTAGNWSVVQGPLKYYEGGTWYAVNAGSQNPELAKKFVEYIAFDKEFVKDYAVSSGDFVANRIVVDEIKDNFTEEFLGGQNHYKDFAVWAEEVDVSQVTAYDEELNRFLEEALRQYIYDGAMKEEALAYFEDSVRAAYPDIVIE